MRILLVNPNTTGAVTERMARAARAVASAGTEIQPVNARFGAAIIGSRAETAFSAAAVIDLLTREAANCDAVIIGASVDSGLAAAREMLDVPVVGITEAALHAACLLGGRCGAVVMSASSGAILREMADAYGLDGRLGPIRALPVTPRDVLADPAAVTRAVGEAARELALGGEVDTVVLVGAVMAGVPAEVQAGVPVPVLEGVSAAVALVEGLVRLRPIAPRAGSYSAPPAARIEAMLQSLNGLF